MEENIQKHKNGMFYCELTDEKYPYSSVTGWGKTDYEAHINAWELRKKILEKQLATDVVIPLSNLK